MEVFIFGSPPRGLPHVSKEAVVSEKFTAGIRATIAATIGLLPVIPVVADQLGLMGIPWVAATVAIAAAISRIISSAQAQVWIQKFAPWLNENKEPKNEP